MKANTFTTFVKRYKSGGGIFNTYMGFVCVRFSLSLVRDVVWYAGLTRKVLLVSLLSSLLWTLWIFRPWVEMNEEIEG